MLGFIIPIKPRKFSKDWQRDNLLLERTVRSVCNQNIADFKVIIIYTDKPEINFTHDQIHYVHFPFRDVKYFELSDWEEQKKWHTPLISERMMDKGRKIALGCQEANKLGCHYLMSVDSDDLVSSRLASFVKGHCVENPAGWRIENGYIYEENSLIAIKDKKIWWINGSTHIIRSDLVEVPDIETNLAFAAFSFFENHKYTNQRLIDRCKEKLESLPFYGVIYLVHGNNFSSISKFVTGRPIRLLIKKFLKGKIINNKIRKEFGLYNLPVTNKSL